MNYTVKELEEWSKTIEEKASEAGLDFYPQEFEIVDYNEMLSLEAYSGMPSRYPHWSFGKAYEKNRTLYNYNLTGLPYEMVINSNPCMAYLMKDNTLLLQILTIAHVYAHNDFFKNNRLFATGTKAEYTVEMFKTNANLIRSYSNDPSIGYERLDKLLNAAHALKFQITRDAAEKKLRPEELKEQLLRDYKNNSDTNGSKPCDKNIKLPDFDKIPPVPEEDILYFLANYGKLEEWQRNVLEIVRREALYFIPQIETKIMNEGWASYWHYNLLKELKLEKGLQLEFLKRHNDVVAPLRGGLNPYYIGFKIFEKLYERHGKEKIFEARKLERDESFLRRYLDLELCTELNLFEYVRKGRDYVIEEVSDEVGYEKVRNTLCAMVGMNNIPVIKVIEVSNKDKMLMLEHEYDGRELNLTYAQAVLKHIVDIWEHPVALKTRINDKEMSVICDEIKRVVIK